MPDDKTTYEWDGECPKCGHDVLDYVGLGKYDGCFGYDEVFHCEVCDTTLKRVTTQALCVVVPEGEVP